MIQESLTKVECRKSTNSFVDLRLTTFDLRWFVAAYWAGVTSGVCRPSSLRRASELVQARNLGLGSPAETFELPSLVTPHRVTRYA